jgi:hypothetical protein
MGDQPYGIDMTTADRIAGEIGEAVKPAMSFAWSLAAETSSGL